MKITIFFININKHPLLLWKVDESIEIWHICICVGALFHNLAKIIKNADIMSPTRRQRTNYWPIRATTQSFDRDINGWFFWVYVKTTNKQVIYIHSFLKLRLLFVVFFVMFLFNSVRYLFVENSTFEGGEEDPNVKHTVSKNWVTLYML